jgi:hypothetical protein
VAGFKNRVFQQIIRIANNFLAELSPKPLQSKRMFGPPTKQFHRRERWNRKIDIFVMAITSTGAGDRHTVCDGKHKLRRKQKKAKM